MRDFILLYINGKEHRVTGKDVFVPITDYLRYDMGACGTKVVCAEGDCGACTVAFGRVEGDKIVYKPVNACIQYVYQLDCSHIITVEGVKLNGKLNPLQDAMVECHGAQCGYCTPGFIMAMCSIYDQGCPINIQSVKEGLTGNLCRCTGYESIIKSALQVDTKSMQKFAELYPDKTMVKSLKEHSVDSVTVEADGKRVFLPTTSKEVSELKDKHSPCTIVSGGTDVSVNMNKKGLVASNIISLSNVQGLHGMKEVDGVLEIGSRVTLTEIEHFMQDNYPEFHYILWVFGSPQIRNAGTLAGNIANASPIGDSLPFLFVMDAEVEVSGLKGSRKIKINELYKGYKQLAMAQDEIITRIFLPLPQDDEIVKLYKISKRQHLDISAFTAGIRVLTDGDKIDSAIVAYGGVAAVVFRLQKVEEFLKGKPYTLETFREAGKLAREEITPLSDVRGSKDFRWQLAENIMVKFFHETATERVLACR